MTIFKGSDICYPIMCGISGILCLDAERIADIRLLREMTNTVRHRGPDDEGYFLCSPETGVRESFSGQDSSAEVKALHPRLDEGEKARLGFGFRRLAILDPGAGGHQPMSDPELGLHIVFNGEIYNHVELREELNRAGYGFRSRSDTEVILKAYHAWGDDCLKRFNGIWVLAIWDEKQRRLFCARDRFGVKPFYYCIHDQVLYFGSEIKQLLLTPVNKSLNRPMLWRAMKINSLQVYGGETFWTNIHALEPGTAMAVKDGQIAVWTHHRLDPSTFGSSSLSLEDATERYRALFQRAVGWQMRSDVEVGACLSGGLDSSAIVCSAVRHSDIQLQTFSSYFAELPQLDERRWIAEVASACGCVSHLTSPKVDDALQWFAEATWFNDLPLGAGFAAQYAVMRLAREHGVKVLLDGQGSDELTAGYKHAQYRWLGDLLRDRRQGKIGTELKAYLSNHTLPQNLAGIAKTLLAAAFPESRLYEMEFWHLRFEPFNREFTTQAKRSLETGILSRIADLEGTRLANFLYNEVYFTSLPTLLHWEDRMSMAASIESRVPFLDHELVEFAFSLPSAFKIRHASGKHIHRQAMRPIVPRAIAERRDKAVFGSPFHAVWLRGGMKAAVNELFSSTEFRRRGIWDLPRVWANWQKYQKGDNSQAEMIFNVFALENWFRSFGPWIEFDLQT